MLRVASFLRIVAVLFVAVLLFVRPAHADNDDYFSTGPILLNGGWYHSDCHRDCEDGCAVVDEGTPMEELLNPPLPTHTFVQNGKTYCVDADGNLISVTPAPVAGR